MKEQLLFIWYSIKENSGKVFLLTVFLLSTNYLRTSEVETKQSEIVTLFEHDHKEYFIYHTGASNNSENDYRFKEMDNDMEDKVDFENMIYTHGDLTFGQILSGLLFFISAIVLIVALFNTYEYPWNMAQSKAKAGMHAVKVFEEDGSFYYKYRGKLLFSIHNKGHADPNVIYNELYSFHKSKSNLYPDFEAPTRKLRNDRLRDILTNKK